MQTYAHVLGQTKRDVAAQMDAILSLVATVAGPMALLLFDDGFFPRNLGPI